jgi:hypothetical protein
MGSTPCAGVTEWDVSASLAKGIRRDSAIGFSAVSDAKDTDGFFVLIEPDAIVADAKAVLLGVDALEFLHVASGGLCESINGLLDTASICLVEGRHALKCVLSPLDSLHDV